MKPESEYEKARRDAYTPLVERVSEECDKEHIFIYTLCCGLGWKDIVFKIVEKLDQVWDGYQGKKGSAVWKILQVKEKFGELRFYGGYPDGDRDRVEKSWAVISEGVEEAAKLCERCGKTGRIVTIGGRLASVCNECEKRWRDRKAQGAWPALYG